MSEMYRRTIWECDPEPSHMLGATSIPVCCYRRLSSQDSSECLVVHKSPTKYIDEDSESLVDQRTATKYIDEDSECLVNQKSATEYIDEGSSE